MQESKVTESLVYVDDFCLQDLGLSVRLSSSEPALPNIRNQSVVVPNRHGAFDYGGWLEPREFVLNCVLNRRANYTELKQAIRDLNALFIDEWGRPKTVRLAFGDEPSVHYNVRLTDGVQMERIAKQGIFSLTLTAFDPYAYSNVSSEEVVWGSDDIYFTATYKLGHENVGTVRITAPTTIKSTVDGGALRPTFELVGTATSVQMSANNKSFSLGAFSNATIIIDGANFSVHKDGISTLALMSGDFLELLNGENTIQITGSVMNFDLRVKFRDKYI